eukprot:TRINITY_DN4589_c0_g1_i1.p1 TRINITY_DN4589_c0_g1~~TRINITY_DN4589_c0_g1_i1.p1  ORF type:complete len:1503 (+),score=306.15 TRINITY_DN4589_c0_g1_i1:48-4556(+)
MTHIDNLLSLTFEGRQMIHENDDLSRSELYNVISDMLYSDHPIRQRKVHVRKKKIKAFYGSDLFDWLLRNFSVDEAHALSTAQSLIDESLIIEVQSQNLEGVFHNGNSLYRTTFENKMAFLCSRGLTTYYFDEFWYSYKEVDSHPVIDGILSRLCSYVPRLVIKDAINSDHRIIETPFLTNFPACVLFADISGFTPLCETLGKKGKLGIELLTRHLNSYFGRMIGLIRSHGGDVIKFAGDALLAAWPCESESSLPFMITLVSQCALAMQMQLHGYLAEGCKLTLHIGIGAGNISGVHVGGVKGRSEFILAGQPLDQVSECEKAALSGEVYISQEAATLIADNVIISVGSSKPTILSQFPAKYEHPNYRLEQVIKFCPLPDVVPVPQFENMLEAVRPYVQPAVMSHLNSGAPDHFLAEIRPVSIIFVNLDLTYSDEEIDRIQSGVCAMQEAVYEYEGVIRQFIIDDKGSVLIAAFGLPPLFHEDDTVLAVKSAILLQEKLSALGINTSVGITTGEVFCGAVGNSDRREYALVGDLVNLSARLMGNAKGGILVDINTYKKSQQDIIFEDLDTIMVKGKSEPIRIFSPTGIQKPLSSSQFNTSFSRGSAVTIGRAKEIRKIMKMIKYFEGKENRPMQILVTGEAGIGKSHVLNSIMESTEEETELQIFSATASNDRKDQIFYLWKDILLSVLKIGKKVIYDMDPAERTELICESLRRLELDTTYAPLLSPVINLELETNEVCEAFSAQLKSLHSKQLLTDIFSGLKKTAFFFDDAQWIDPKSWELIHEFCSFPNLLFVIFERDQSDGSAKLLKKKPCQQIVMESLSKEAIADVLIFRLKANEIEDNLLDLIHKKGHGNPFQCLQIMEGLISLNEITIENNLVSLKNSTSLDSIENMNSLIIAKIDRLPRKQAIVLKYASIIGCSFNSEVLEQISDLESDELISVLDEFISMGFLEKTEEEHEYSFIQDMIRDTIYEMMLFSQRQEVHGKIARIYEDNIDALGISHVTLAHHYQRAENKEKTVLHLDCAIAIAESEFLFDQIIEFVTQILEIVAPPVFSKKLSQEQVSKNLRHLRWRRQLGESYFFSGQFSKAKPIFLEGLDIIGQSVNVKENKLLFKEIKKNSSIHFDRKALRAMSGGKVNKYNDINVGHEVTRSLIGLGKIAYHSCNYPEFAYCTLAARKQASEVGLSAETLDVLAMTVILFGIENLPHADQFLQETNAISSQVKNYSSSNISTVTWMISLYYLGKAKFDSSLEYIDKAISMHEENNNLRGAEDSKLTKAFSYLVQGNFGLAKSISLEVSTTARQRYGFTYIQYLMYSAYLELMQCNYSAAKLNILELFAMSSRGSFDLTTQFNYGCISAMGQFLQKKYDYAVVNGEDMMEMLERISFTNCYAFIGLAVLNLFCYVIYQKTQDQRFANQFKYAVKYLGQFADKFPFAYPRYCFWSGMLSTVNNSGNSKIWEEGLKKAEELKLVFDTAILKYRLGHFNSNIELAQEAVNILAGIG